MRHLYGEPESTSAAEVSRNFGHWQDKAISGPVVVTHHGRPRVVIVSADQFATWREQPAQPHGEKPALEFETSLSAVLDHMDQAFIALDGDLRVTALNGVALSFFGLSRQQVMGVRATDIYPALTGSVFLDRVHRVLRSGLHTTFETNALLFPGRSATVSVFPYPGGVGILSRNTTEEKLNAEVLNSAKACIDAMSLSNKVLHLMLNVRGAMGEVSDSFCRFVGLGRQELLRTRFVDLVPVVDRQRLHMVLEDLFQYGKSSLHRCHMHTKNAVETVIELSMAPIYDDVSIVGAYVILSPDLVPETSP